MKTLIKKTLVYELLEDNTIWRITYTSGALSIIIEINEDELKKHLNKEIGYITLNDIALLEKMINEDDYTTACSRRVITQTTQKETFLNQEKNIKIEIEDKEFVTLTYEGREYKTTIHNVLLKSGNITNITPHHFIMLENNTSLFSLKGL